ncbi:MAG: dockerin type I repeat-containing protein [Planctomycetes bacterium]|nr:dockerin type I repeat-containing protein [Planctomycetota bacterium]
MATTRKEHGVQGLAAAALLALGASLALADPPTLEWSQTYSGLGWAQGYGIAVDGDSVYVAGGTAIPDQRADMFLATLDLDGNHVWDRTWGGSRIDWGWSVATFGECAYVGGHTYTYVYDPNGPENADAVTVKWSQDGVLDTTNSPDGWWTRFHGCFPCSGGFDAVMDMAVDDLGNLYTMGCTGWYNSPDRVYLAKYDPSGVDQWCRSYAWGIGYPEQGCYGRGLALCDDNLFAAGGVHTVNWWSVAVWKCDSIGTLQWTYVSDNADVSERANDVAVSGDDIYLAGVVETNNEPDGCDLIVMRLRDEGTSASYVDCAVFDGPGDDVGYGIVVAEDTVYVVGSSYVGGHRDALLLAYDTDLTLLWSLTWGGADNDVANDVCFHDGLLYVTGTQSDEAFISAYAIVALIPGDLNGDGDVDLYDLAALLAVYGTCDGDPDFNPVADLDGNGCVDLGDLAELLGHFGEGP